MTAADLAFVLAVVCVVGIIGSLLIGWFADPLADEDFDRCGECRTPLDDRNRAITCGDHPLCLSCDGPTPCCHVGRYRRENPVWTVASDPFLDTTGGAA